MMYSIKVHDQLIKKYQEVYELHGLGFELSLQRAISKGKFYVSLTENSDLVSYILKKYSVEFLERFFIYMGYKFDAKINMNGVREYTISW